jgi:hypothetical protein
LEVLSVAVTPNAVVRVPPELADEARARVGQPDVSLSVLLRAGLAMVAGYALGDALALARSRPGPKSKAGAIR